MSERDKGTLNQLLLVGHKILEHLGTYREQCLRYDIALSSCKSIGLTLLQMRAVTAYFSVNAVELCSREPMTLLGLPIHGRTVKKYKR